MENSLQIFTNEEFGQLRTLVVNGEPWAVGKDVAEILGYKDTDQAIRNHVDEEDKLTRKFNGSGQNREMVIINESGLYSLILSSKLPKAKEFKRWVTSEVLPSIRKTGGYSVKPTKISNPYTPATNSLVDAHQFADEIQSLFVGVKRGIAISQALDIASEMHNAPLQSLKQLLPPADHDTGFMNATQIGEKLGGVSPRAVNKLLANAKLQYKDGKHWRITDYGAEYGEEMPYTKNGHSGYQIRWSEKVIPLFEKC